MNYILYNDLYKWIIYLIFRLLKSNSLTVEGFNLFRSALIWLPASLKSLLLGTEMAGIPYTQIFPRNFI
jgi:hypothetical protein